MSVQVSAPAADHDLGPLMAGFSQDFGNLKAEFDRLLGNLSASVHDATELTLEHTALYDTAVGELQVRHRPNTQQAALISIMPLSCHRWTSNTCADP